MRCLNVAQCGSRPPSRSRVRCDLLAKSALGTRIVILVLP